MIQIIFRCLPIALFTISFAQAQGLSGKGTPAVGSVGYDISAITGRINGLESHILNDQERAEALSKFGIKAADAVALVGIKYEVTDSNGKLLETGWIWSDIVKDPTMNSVFSKLKAMDNSLLNQALTTYSQKQDQLTAAANQEILERAKNTPATQDLVQESSQTNREANAGFTNANAQKKSPSKIEVVVIGTHWCPYCVDMKKTITNLKDNKTFGDNVTYQYFDREVDPSVVQKYNAHSTPTVIFFKDGVEVKHCNGSPGFDGTVQMINSLQQ